MSPRTRLSRPVGMVLLLLVSIAPVALVGGSAPHTLLGLEPFLHSNGASPGAMKRASIAFDTADGYAVMFGGLEYTSLVLATTWTFVHGNWTNLTPSLGVFPPARWAASMAWDPGIGKIILFGGCPTIGCPSSLGDTWAYSRGGWVDLTPSLNGSPSPREGAMMTWDAADGYLLLYGGERGANQASYGDLWAFEGSRWVAITLAAGSPVPTGRAGGVLSYDPSINATLLFGGTTGSTPVFGDTWTYKARNWTDLTPTLSAVPSGRSGSSMVYDGTDGYQLLVGGYAGGTFLGDVWSFQHAAWLKLTPAGSPPDPLSGSMMVFDPVDGVVLLFSGAGEGGYWTATWTYAHGTWVLLINPAGSSPPLPAYFLGWFFVVPVLLILGAVSAGQWLRDRRAPVAFTLAPGEPVRWVPTTSLWRRGVGSGATIVLVAIFFPFLLISTLGSSGSAFDTVLFSIVPLILLLVVAVGLSATTVIRSVGVARQGVIFQKRRREIRIVWGDLKPDPNPLRRGSFIWKYPDPKMAMGASWFAVTTDQARAILDSEYAPDWPIEPTIARALGLAPRPAAQAVVPPYATPPPPPPSPPSAPPLRTSTPAAAPPPPPLRPSPLSRAPPPPVVPRLPKCPGCGTPFTPGQFAFCQRCGRRLL